MAYIIEAAGGAASDGFMPILDIVPTSLHGSVASASTARTGEEEDPAEPGSEVVISVAFRS